MENILTIISLIIAVIAVVASVYSFMINSRIRMYSKESSYQAEATRERLREIEMRYERRMEEMEMRYKEKYRRGDFSDIDYEVFQKLRHFMAEFEYSLERKLKDIAPQKIDYQMLAKELRGHSVDSSVSDLYKARAMDISHIVFNVLHIIRTPLSGIVACSNSIINKTVDDEIKEKCLNAVSYTEMIENGLSSFASIRSIGDDNTQESLANRLGNEVKLLLLTSPKKIDCSLEQDTDVIMPNSDINCLMLCVSCVIENAMYYSQDNSKILIKVSKDGDINQLSITNFGPHIPYENREKIFDEGFSTKNGSGFGLSIAKRVIETNFNGKISYENIKEPQPGVTFTLLFRSE